MRSDRATRRGLVLVELTRPPFSGPKVFSTGTLTLSYEREYEIENGASVSGSGEERTRRRRVFRSRTVRARKKVGVSDESVSKVRKSMSSINLR